MWIKFAKSPEFIAIVLPPGPSVHKSQCAIYQDCFLAHKDPVVRSCIIDATGKEKWFVARKFWAEWKTNFPLSPKLSGSERTSCSEPHYWCGSGKEKLCGLASDSDSYAYSIVQNSKNFTFWCSDGSSEKKNVAAPFVFGSATL
jgi:hypothetical protein